MQHELSSRYQIRSLPTFQFFVGGKKVQESKGGIGEAALIQETDRAVRQAEAENVLLTLDALKEYYGTVDASKPAADIETVHQKCVDMIYENDVVSQIFGGKGKVARNQNSPSGSHPHLLIFNTYRTRTTCRTKTIHGAPN